jgi:serine/threonine protein kinase
MKLTRTGTLVGTPFYMAPEQINGGKVDVRTDLYAVGVILYEMCTGKLPFGGETLGEVLIGHLQKTVPPLPAETQQWGIPHGGRADLWPSCSPSPPDERYCHGHGADAGLSTGCSAASRPRRASIKRLTLSSLPPVAVPPPSALRRCWRCCPLCCVRWRSGATLLVDKLRGTGARRSRSTWCRCARWP